MPPLALPSPNEPVATPPKDCELADGYVQLAAAHDGGHRRAPQLRTADLNARRREPQIDVKVV